MIDAIPIGCTHTKSAIAKAMPAIHLRFFRFSGSNTYLRYRNKTIIAAKTGISMYAVPI